MKMLVLHVLIHIQNASNHKGNILSQRSQADLGAVRCRSEGSNDSELFLKSNQEEVLRRTDKARQRPSQAVVWVHVRLDLDGRALSNNEERGRLVSVRRKFRIQSYRQFLLLC